MNQKRVGRISFAARMKLMLGRVMGYIVMATFFLVLLEYADNMQQSFPNISLSVFRAIFIILAIVGIIAVAELDWRFLFKQEQGQAQFKSPLLEPWMFNTAWMIAEYEGEISPKILDKLRESFKVIGVEEGFDEFIALLKEGKVT